MNRLLLVLICLAGLLLAPPDAAAETDPPPWIKYYVGYTIYQNMAETGVTMIGMSGETIKQWRPDGYATTYSAKPLDNGRILALAARTDCPSANVLGLIELDFSGEVVWSYFHPDDISAHHDFERLSNGDTLILMKVPVADRAVSKINLADDLIIEVDPDGNTVWEWLASDHFAELGFDDTARALIYEAGGDYLHANSIQSLPRTDLADDLRFAEGNIMVSFRAANLIIIIDKTTGGVVWRSGPQLPATIAQHNAHLIAPGLPGEGRLLVFDNGGIAGYPPLERYYSQVLEIDPISWETAWAYPPLGTEGVRDRFFSRYVSGAQRLPNGNTLVCDGDNSRLVELSAEGERVWEYVDQKVGDEFNPGAYGNSIYRAVRVGRDWVP